jgi:hypothetical protein
MNAEKKKFDPLQILAKYVVTKEQVSEMVETRLIWKKIIASSHSQAWIARGNGGKTLIAKHACAQLAKIGYDVFYFQEDAGGGDLPKLQTHAHENGYKLMNSMINNTSVKEMLNSLNQLTMSDVDLSNHFYVFDTLKKFVDPNNKREVREFFTLMRNLTVQGAGLTVLGHTTKREGKGDLMFDGVGDIRDDVDELIYIEATEKDSYGKITFTMKPDKVRCLAEEASFEFDSINNLLTELDHVVDVESINNAQEQLAKDEPIIAIITELLNKQDYPITELVKTTKRHCNFGEKYLRALIERYLDSNPDSISVKWIEKPQGLNNTKMISMDIF